MLLLSRMCLLSGGVTGVLRIKYPSGGRLMAYVTGSAMTDPVRGPVRQTRASKAKPLNRKHRGDQMLNTPSSWDFTIRMEEM